MSWRTVRTDDGSWTLAHPVHGEACHSSTGAWTEARERYAGPCRLAALARDRDAVALLDVGTGPGWNLAAALSAVAGTGARLSVVTLERDRAAIETRLPTGAAGEPWIGRARDALTRALDGGGEVALDGGHRLQLWLGDARDTLAALPDASRFDAVFLDPFSPAVEPELWGDAFLVAIARRMSPHAVLSTYSAATAVRVGLARAGLRVARGPRVGAKREGTLAGRGLVPGPGDADLARRLRRRLGGEIRSEGRERAPGFA